MLKKKYLFIKYEVIFCVCMTDKVEDIRFFPKVIGVLNDIVRETDYKLIIISNRNENSCSIAQFFNNILKSEGVNFDDVDIKDLNFKGSFLKNQIIELTDVENSYLIGNCEDDIKLAAHIGIKPVLIGTGADLLAVFIADNWNEIYDFLLKRCRKASIERRTNETDIRITVDLNGTGNAKIHTGIGFFDHMLEQISKHGGIDLSIEAKGDLNVDEHHTIEDVGIALGQVFLQALGTKKGIERYGFSLPMDESEAKVLLDFGGRSYLVWSVELTREYVGDFPTEMAEHFFNAFCQSACCNLNISAKGENAHHILEAAFKAFARCIKQAITKNGDAIPSSKGTL